MRRYAAILILALVPACGQTHRPIPPEGVAGPEVVGVSYTQDVWPILIVRCQVCHTTGTGAEQVPNMLMTDPSSTYDAWFNVFAQCNPNLYRVFPGDSGMSFVFDKISQNGPMCGFRMPLLGPPLDDSDQNTIRDWIDQGARRN